MKTSLRVALALLVLAQPAFSTTYTVTDTSDSGTDTGSLRYQVTSAISAGGANTIAWGAGSGGTINLLSGLPDLASTNATTFDASAAPSAVTIQGGSISSEGAMTFANTNTSQPWSIYSPIGGAGALTKTGAGELDLYSGNSYGGGTTISGGALGINQDGALGGGNLTFDGGTLKILTQTLSDGRTITITGNGGTIDLEGSSTTLSGVITGPGALTVGVSTGALYLTGSNLYTGTTIENGALVNVIGDNNLGVSTGTLTLNGGTLQTGAAIVSSRPISLGNGGGTIDTFGFNSTLNGVISGSGALTEIGGGVLTLGAVNTYSGGTNVNVGTLQYGINNALPAGYAVNVAQGATIDMNGFYQTAALGAVINSGTINMHAETLNMGSYSGAGILAFEIPSATPGTMINVTNTMNVSQAKFNVTMPVSVLSGLTDNTTFTGLIKTGGFTGGSITSSQITTPAAFTLNPTQNGNNEDFQVQLNKFTSLAGNQNQAAVGAAMDALRGNTATAPTGDLAQVLGNLYSLNAGQLQAALDQIGPISLASMQAVGLTNSSLEGGAISRRVDALADGRTSDGLDTYAVNPQSAAPGDLYADPLGDSPEIIDDEDENRPEPPHSPWGFFGSAVGTSGRLAEAHTAAGLQPGYAFDSGGAVGGADYRFTNHLAGGFAAGYLHGHSSIYAPASGTVDNDSARFGVYGAAYGSNLRGDLYVGGASDHFQTNRGILFGSLERTATGSPDGSEFNMSARVRYDVDVPAYGIFSPFTDFDYDRLMINGFTESGADTLDLAVGAQTAESARSTVGLRYSEVFHNNGSSYQPYGSLGWRHEFDPQSRPIEAQLASGAGNPFTVASGDYARDGVALGAGADVDWNQALTFKVDYSGDFRSHFLENIYDVTARYRF